MEAPSQDALDQFAFSAADRLIGTSLVLKEERSRAARILVEELEKFIGTDVKMEGASEGYGG